MSEYDPVMVPVLQVILFIARACMLKVFIDNSSLPDISLRK